MDMQAHGRTWQGSWFTQGVSHGLRRTIVGAALLAAGAGAAAGQPGPGTLPDRPTFRSSVDLVSVAAVVRDRRGHVVRDLSRDDFIVLENGSQRRIVEFSPAEEGPVSVALLFDVSGSMAMAPNRAAARRAVDHLLSWLNPGADEVALYAFDSRLEEVQPFTADAETVRGSLGRLGSFGMTSLYDAIGGVARQLAARTSRRRAILVVTDGLDNGSRLSSAEVSGLASATDVPVYVIAVVSPIDREGDREFVGGGKVAAATGALSKLAWWTGGEAFVVAGDADASLAARAVLVALRHQYVLAFESAGPAGWRPLDIRLRRRELTVRARSGYFSTPAVRPLG
jgi:Ca-activated chloride channel family protein